MKTAGVAGGFFIVSKKLSTLLIFLLFFSPGIF